MAWNPTKPNLLAVGLDRATKEPSLLVWDVNTKTLTLGEKRRINPAASADQPYFRHAGVGNKGTARTDGPTELSVWPSS